MKSTPTSVKDNQVLQNITPTSFNKTHTGLSFLAKMFPLDKKQKINFTDAKKKNLSTVKTPENMTTSLLSETLI